MSDINQKCAYHPTKEMVAHCSRCRRPICYPDLRKYDKLDGKGAILTEVDPKDYCLICFSTKLSLDLKKWSRNYVMVSLIVIIVFVIISFYTILALLLIVFLSLVFFWEFNQINLKKDTPVEEAISLINSLDDDQINILSKDNSLECYEYKTEIEKNDNFCPKCGDSTKEKLLFIDS